MMETDMAGMTEIPEAMKFRTTWTKGAGYRPYITLHDTWGFDIGDWVDVTLFGTQSRPTLTQVLCAEPGKGRLQSLVVYLPRTWFKAITSSETVFVELSLNRPASDTPSIGPDTEVSE